MPKSITTPFKITPIAKYRNLLNGSPEQITLTQLSRRNQVHAKRTVYANNEEDFRKKSAKMDDHETSSIVCLDVQSSDEECSNHVSNPIKVNTPSPVPVNNKKIQAGDLVMTNAGRIEHPCYLSGVIHDPYILFGVVRSLTSMDWGSVKKGNWKKQSYNQERVNVEWVPVEAGDRVFVDEKIKDTWTDTSVNPVSSVYTYDNYLLITKVKAPDVDAKDVTLLAKKDQQDLGHLNVFLASEIRKHYHFTTNNGWCGNFDPFIRIPSSNECKCEPQCKCKTRTPD